MAFTEFGESVLGASGRSERGSPLGPIEETGQQLAKRGFGVKTGAVEGEGLVYDVRPLHLRANPDSFTGRPVALTLPSPHPVRICGEREGAEGGT